jgi:cell wall-associated NlpC family hydrolase
MDGGGRSTDSSRGVPARVFLVVMLLVSAGCATTGTARPLPFPGATPPPEPVSVAPAPPAAPAGIVPAPPVITSAPIPNAPAAPAGSDAIVDTALGYRGVPYVLGGDNPKAGFDCSGLVQYVFAAHAIDVPRTVAEQYRVGVPVKLADLLPGDLVFFSTIGPGPTHVGIAISRDEFVHAPNSKGVVRVEPVDSPYWHDRFVGARRVSALYRRDPLQ